MCGEGRLGTPAQPSTRHERAALPPRPRKEHAVAHANQRRERDTCARPDTCAFHAPRNNGQRGGDQAGSGA